MEKIRPGTINRVVGATPDKEKEMIAINKATFDGNYIPKLRDEVAELSEEQTRAIKLAHEVANEMLRSMGIQEFSVPAKNLHVIKKKYWADYKNETASAFADLTKGHIFIQEGLPLTAFAEAALHEFFHMRSYNALQVPFAKDATSQRLAPYRTGLQLHTRPDHTKVRFNALNEALMEELTRQCCKTLFKDAIFADEVNAFEKIKKLPNLQDDTGKRLSFENVFYAQISEEKVSGKTTTGTFHKWEFAHASERNALHILENKIYVRNRKHFPIGLNGVSQMFIRAAMDGNMLPLRIVDKTFGKGTLKKISEFEEGSGDLERFVKRL